MRAQYASFRDTRAKPSRAGVFFCFQCITTGCNLMIGHIRWLLGALSGDGRGWIRRVSGVRTTASSQRVARTGPHVWMLGYLSFLAVMAALISFISASTAPPGVLNPKTLKYFDNYAYDNALYFPDRECTTCNTIKLARSKHCSVCNVCIPRFDHHCVWLNSCIGEGNYLAFFRFLLANVLLCAYGSYVLFFILYDEYVELVGEEFVHESTNAVIESNTRVVVQYLIHSEATITVLFLMCSVMGSALFCFFVFHCYLVAINTTTNEFFKRRTLAKKKKTRQTHLYSLKSASANFLELWRPRYIAKLREIAAERRHIKIN